MRVHRSLLIALALGLGACTDPKIVSLVPDGGVDGDVGPVDGGAMDGALDADAAPVDAGPPDASSPCGPAPETGVGVGPAGECEVSILPARPRECDPDARNLTLRLALRGPDLRPLAGPDLDGFCTDTAGAAPACTSSDIPRGDRAQGYDNGWIDVFTGLLLFEPSFETTLGMGEDTGLGVPLLEVVGWNGEPFDEEVDVTVLSSVSGVGSGGGPVAWDGGDVYLPSDRWFAGDVPLVRDRNAYVANGRLVASLPDGVPLFLPYRPGVDYPVILDEGRLVATLDPVTETVSEARFIGRWSLASAIESLDAFGLCEGSVDPMVVMGRATGIKILTDGADVRLDPVDDGGDPLLPCNAISLQAVWSESVVATWGDPVAPTSVTTLCP